MAKAPLRQLSMSVIDQNVLRGNEKNAPRKHARISQHGSAIPGAALPAPQRHDRLGVQRRTARRRVRLPRVLPSLRGLEVAPSALGGTSTISRPKRTFVQRREILQNSRHRTKGATWRRRPC